MKNEEINKLKDDKISILEENISKDKELYKTKLELFKLKNNL